MSNVVVNMADRVAKFVISPEPAIRAVSKNSN
jgi:hypothetical protein